MDPRLVNVLIFGVLAGGGTVLGMYLVLLNQAWALRNSIFLISFAAGVLLAAAFIEILPESLELGRDALVFVLLSFMAFYVLEKYILFHTHHHEHGQDPDPAGPAHTMGWVAFIGLTFHSLLDGLIIGTGFQVDFSLGLIASIGIIAHEIPEGISIVSIMLRDGFSRIATTLYSWTVAMATPLGAVLAFFALRGGSEQALGFLLAVASGSFIYIAASDLIPETHHHHSLSSVFLVICGAGVILLSRAILG